MRVPGPLLLLALLGPVPGAAAAAEDECAIEPAVIPDFSLADVNPGSPTYGATLSRGDFLGRVIVIYWAVST